MRLYQPILVGRCGDQQVSLVGFANDEFAILVGETVVHSGRGDEVDAGVDMFLSMIERPTTGGAPTVVPPPVYLLSA